MTKQWTLEEAEQLFYQPFTELSYIAQTVHRKHFNPNVVQISTLLNIKTGSCPENCAYCPQSAHYNTGLKKEPLMEKEEILAAARRAKDAGSTRFCMGAAWRTPRDSDLEKVCDIVQSVKELGMETCVTLGMLQDHQADRLKEAGLDFYNHNIDTSEEYYDKIITTRSFEDRINTLNCVQKSGLKTCSGGILGMGETNRDRLKMLMTLANMEHPPTSVPINKLIKIPGTPLEHAEEVDPFDFVRTVAMARIMMPQAYIRLSAGREQMSDELQALCFMVGINSIFYGEKLLTAANPAPQHDNRLFNRLGLQKQQ